METQHGRKRPRGAPATHDQGRLLRRKRHHQGPAEDASGSSKRCIEEAFETHFEQTKEHVSRLEEVFKLLGKKPEAIPCEAIKGIIKEGDEVAEQFKDEPALDAGLIAAAQAVEHYEIARYGAMRAWAERLGMDDVVELFEETLAEEEDTDKLLSELAEGEVNEEAEDA